MNSRVARANGVHRTYLSPTGERLHILQGVNLEVSQGEVVAISGESGVGKSTLLHILGLLDSPTRGSLELLGEDTSSLSSRRLASLRNRGIGFVFQFHHLLAELSALENVRMPALLGGDADGTRRASKLLERMGVAERRHHHPAELSGGERQRVAIARALMNEPTLVLADEPTGNLDTETAEVVQDLLLGTVRESGRSAVLVTHDPCLSARADRQLVMTGGRLAPA